MANLIITTTRKNKHDAGRKVGAGKFVEPTIAIPIPASQEHIIKNFVFAYIRKRPQFNMDSINKFTFPVLNAKLISLPLYSSTVSPGFPSPVEEHVEQRLDPSEFLIDQKHATFFVTIQVLSMIDAGLLPDDKAVVDRSKTPSIGDIVIAMLDDEFTIKTLSLHKSGTARLLPANSTGTYSPIGITKEIDFQIWGVFIGSFCRFR